MTITVLQRVLPRPGRGHRVIVVRLRGELDIGDVPALQDCLAGIGRQRPARSIIELTGQEFIDCDERVAGRAHGA